MLIFKGEYLDELLAVNIEVLKGDIKKEIQKYLYYCINMLLRTWYKKTFIFKPVISKSNNNKL